MSEPIWIERHLINVVFEKLVRLSKHGEVPVEEDFLVDDILKDGIRISRRELAKILLTLEIIGKISVEASGHRGSFRVKVLQTK